MKVLLIENSRLYHAFLSKLFESLGYQPIVASSRNKAVAALKQHRFDIICMNMYFEGTNAIKFMPTVRKIDSRVSVIMLTSEKNEDLRSRALGVGITEVIYKANMQELIGLVSNFVRQHMKPDMQQSRVLYVEDSRTEAAVISRLLKSMNLVVDNFNTAESALEQLESNEYDLVITDVLLKGEQSGLWLVKSIRNLPGEKGRIPVLTVTGFDDLARRIELLRAGTNDYIAKPVVKEELQVRVTNLITNKLLVDKVVRQQAQLYKLAITDQLTGCYNRHGFKEFTEKYIAGAKRRNEAISVLVMDLDLFKQVNDNHGHDVGDLVLKGVGKLLTDESRADDLVARYGGEEFILLLPNANKADAMRIAQRLRKKVEALNPADIRITASIGVTHIEPGEEINFDKAFHAADQAVYRAKKRGRNCVSYSKYSPLRAYKK